MKRDEIVFRAGLLALGLAAAAGAGWTARLTGRPPGLSSRNLDQADAARQRGEHAEAARWYARYLAISPYDFRARTFLGLELLALGRWREAEAALDFGKNLNPFEGQLFHGLAVANFKLSEAAAEPERSRRLEEARIYGEAAQRLSQPLDPALMEALGLK